MLFAGDLFTIFIRDNTIFFKYFMFFYVFNGEKKVANSIWEEGAFYTTNTKYFSGVRKKVLI